MIVHRGKSAVTFWAQNDENTMIQVAKRTTSKVPWYFRRHFIPRWLCHDTCWRALAGHDFLASTEKLCWYVTQPLNEIIGHNDNYTVMWLRLGSSPTDKQLDDVLQQMRSNARGSPFLA